MTATVYRQTTMGIFCAVNVQLTQGLIVYKCILHQCEAPANWDHLTTGWLRIKYPTRQYAISLQPVV